MPNIVWPWGYGVLENPMTGVNKDPSVYGPYQPPQIDTQEWSFGSLTTGIQRAVDSATANASRLLYSSNAPAVKQGEPLTTGPAWYDIPGRISAGASAVNEAFQSTLLKIIVVLAIVGIVGVFGMSFLQAKGASLAK